MKLTAAQTRCLNNVLADRTTYVRDNVVHMRLIAMGLIERLEGRAEWEAISEGRSSYALTPAGGKALGYNGPALSEDMA